MINVTVYNEYLHEKSDETVAKIYPSGIHGAVKALLEKDADLCVRTATLEDIETSLSDEVLASTDVLFWWGHIGHGAVPDELAQKVVQRVREGMGFVALHSAHYSKPFKLLMGTGCRLKWRESGDRERMWVVEGWHPIVQGIPEYIDFEKEETYGERFDIPAPDEIVFMSNFSGGEVFRSGCTFHRGLGKIFYFKPGHEAYPIYHMEVVGQILRNAAHWAYTPKPVVPTFGQFLV